MQLRLSGICLLLGCSAHACGDTERNAPDAGLPGSWPPDECMELTSPFTSEGCLEALNVTCRSKLAADACSAQATARVGEYDVQCVWVPVVTLADQESCEVQSVDYRCEARHDPEQLLLPCGDPCESPPELWWAWTAIPTELELIKMCGRPLGPWATSGSGSSYLGVCMDNVEPPAPGLCDCTRAACDALSGAAGSTGG